MSCAPTSEHIPVMGLFEAHLTVQVGKLMLSAARLGGRAVQDAS